MNMRSLHLGATVRTPDGIGTVVQLVADWSGSPYDWASSALFHGRVTVRYGIDQVQDGKFLKEHPGQDVVLESVA